MSGLRIIAGSLKGRRIQLPRGHAVRPTAERVREALFSILGQQVLDAQVLDVYAGSGALGFEALSRGARSVVFVERHPDAARGIRENARRLGVADRCRVISGEALAVLGGSRGAGPFQLILADPPYGEAAVPALLEAIERGARLEPQGLLVLERDRGDPPLEPASQAGLSLLRQVFHGRTRLDFYGWADPVPALG